MFKQALIALLTAVLFVFSSFSGKLGPKWVASLKLEGNGKSVLLTSNAIHGGHDPYSKKFFFFGKNHMFLNKQDLENSKIFNDLCVTNNTLQFQMEFNNALETTATKAGKVLNGNILFIKRKPIKGTFSLNRSGENQIIVKGKLQDLGFTLTPEAEKVFNGEFTLILTNIK